MFQSLKKLLGIKLKNTRIPVEMTAEQTEGVAKSVCNTINPFTMSNSNETARLMIDIINNSPPFGSPENLRELAKAQKTGEEIFAKYEALQQQKKIGLKDSHALDPAKRHQRP